jgi:hypothetical protein
VRVSTALPQLHGGLLGGPVKGTPPDSGFDEMAIAEAGMDEYRDRPTAPARYRPST